MAVSYAGVATALPVLGGYDVVAYFSLPRSTKGPAAHGIMGSAAHAVNISTIDASSGGRKSLGNYEFWFESAANKAKFSPVSPGYDKKLI